MRKRIKILSLNRRRDHADEIGTAEAVAYFAGITAEIAAHQGEPLGADDGQDDVDAEPWTADPDPHAADPDAETQQIPAVLAAAAHDQTEQLPMIHTPQPDIRQRPPAPPATGPGWSEQDARDRGAEVAELIEQQTAAWLAEQQLPVPRRRHLPAVGAWFADRMRPVPLPAIPDADRFTAVIPVPAVNRLVPAAELGNDRAAQAQHSGRLALEAAASTEAPGEHPDDFVEWLRAEFADIDRRYEAALAEHAHTARTDLTALRTDYFQDADRTLDELNAMTLPGWTTLENDLYRTGVFA